MNQEVSDISIKGFDEERSLLHAHGGAYAFQLELSPIPPPEWNQFFNDSLDELSVVAPLLGGYIVLMCAIEELTQERVNRLKQVVSNANQKYREHLAQKRQGQEALNQRALEAMRKLKF